MTGPKGNREFCFHSSPRDQSLSVLLYSTGQVQLNALITCNRGQHYAGNGELFPV